MTSKNKPLTRRVLSCETCPPSIVHFGGNPDKGGRVAYCYCGIDDRHHLMECSEEEDGLVFSCPKCEREYRPSEPTCHAPAHDNEPRDVSVVRSSPSVPRMEDET